MSHVVERHYPRLDGEQVVGRLVEPVSVGCEAVRQVEPHAVGATYWFEAAHRGDPYPVTIRFFARRVGARKGSRADGERTQYERVDRVVPGSGRISVTTRFDGITPGEWEIFAAPANNPREPGIPSGWANPTPLRLPRASTVVESGFAPVVKATAPAVRFGAWPALVLAGVVTALALQGWLASRTGLAVTDTLSVSLIASAVGLVGAKAWYLALHRERPRTLLEAVSAGMCIQGFVVAAVATLALGTLVVVSPLGAVLDVTVPGLLFAMAIGRIGCLLGGCCAGRGTRSRFGVWSSDRRIGMRRVPVQPLESALAASLATSALLADLLGRAHPGGAVAVVALAAYTGLRQLLFPLRMERRQTRYARVFNLAISFATALAIVAVAAGHPQPPG